MGERRTHIIDPDAFVRSGSERAWCGAYMARYSPLVEHPSDANCERCLRRHSAWTVLNVPLERMTIEEASRRQRSTSGLLSTGTSVKLVGRMLGGAIRPEMFLLADGVLVARLTVDPDIAVAVLAAVSPGTEEPKS